MHKILVWDLPTRLFHWLFAASFAGAWLTAESDAWLGVHTFLGYLMLGLIGFRLVWGVAGGRYARFSSFFYSPREGLAYLSANRLGSARRYLGHNPAGSQAVALLLLLGLLTALSGLFVQGGEEQHGPLVDWLGYGAGRAMKEIHEVLAGTLLAVVIGHLAGVALESWRHRENLPRSMVTGYKLATDPTAASRLHPFSALALAALVALFAAGWFRSGPNANAAAPASTRLSQNAQWREECGSCHLDYHPSLLPARSWERLMAQQDRHFGEDLGLDAGIVSSLLTYARAHAAERHASEAAWKIERSLAPGDAPLRISETPYWTRKHREVRTWTSAKVHGKADCAACHRDAASGQFEDAAIRIPPG
ncbi:MAG: cytochrome b/b6 domain-containing protein [Betaproteobacteria bacterium]|nr:cytochrome b/b6 domain-containing protein [Betaproteobacteria bacterium]